MEIDYKCWASAPERLDEVQRTLTETSSSLWAEERAGGIGPPWTDYDGVPFYRRAAEEARLIARSIRETGQRGCP